MSNKFNKNNPKDFNKFKKNNNYNNGTKKNDETQTLNNNTSSINNKNNKLLTKKYNNKNYNEHKILNELSLVPNRENENENKYKNNNEYYIYLNPDDISTLYYNNLYGNNYYLNNLQNTKSNQTDGYYNNPFELSEQFEKHMLQEYDKIQKTLENPKKVYKWIELPNIKNIQDLIEIGKQWNIKWTDEYDYNINLKLINNIVPELEELNKMIGLNDIKNQIIDLIIYRALGLENKNNDLLHTVIEGEPGTGKTEFAEKLAKIYLKLGILKNNIFKKVKRSDLIAGYLGQTAIKTSNIIEECKGGVLFIDEAYSLGNAEGKDGKDSFSKECIDILNQSLTEFKSDFICIIAGYSDDLTKSFFSFNSGLERRFPIRFTINPYTDEELGKIFVKKIKEYEWDTNIDFSELTQIIKSNRIYFKFNGGDMEILFSKCKISHSKNLLKYENKIKKILDKQDILDGINLYLLNPYIKKRNEDNNIKKYIQNTLYI